MAKHRQHAVCKHCGQYRLLPSDMELGHIIMCALTSFVVGHDIKCIPLLGQVEAVTGQELGGVRHRLC